MFASVSQSLYFYSISILHFARTGSCFQSLTQGTNTVILIVITKLLDLAQTVKESKHLILHNTTTAVTGKQGFLIATAGATQYFLFPFFLVFWGGHCSTLLQC